MPLNVHLDVNGRVIGRLTLRNCGAVVDGDGVPVDASSGGLRRYDATLHDLDGGTLAAVSLTHARRDGAWALTSAAIDKLAADGVLPAFE